jgi:hypothetical protein
MRGGGDLSFKGSIDDVRIYGRALSSLEIQQLDAQDRVLALGFTGWSLTPGGALVPELSARPGSIIRIDSSDNLIQWQPILTVTNVLGTARFTDPDTRSFKYRFYRGVVQP